MGDEVKLYRVVDLGTGRTMRSRRTGDLALYEDLGAARRSANAYRGYYGVSRAFSAQELAVYPSDDGSGPELYWRTVG